MDLSQNKLTRSEWESIEVPVSVSEKQILQMITDGYSNINIRLNESQSLFSFIKIEQNEEAELFLYKTYFEEKLLKYINKYGKNTPLLEHLSKLKNQKNGNNHIKKVDSIRIKNLADNIKTNKKFIFEFLLIELLEELLYKLHKNNNEYSFYLYTIIQLSKVNINKINKYIKNDLNDNFKPMFYSDRTLDNYETSFHHFPSIYELVKTYPLPEIVEKKKK